ncbi:MAG TPA: ribosome maturation factor RimM [Armatimonadota bacterium]|nr:ribosome maturation factor RimM [Armatimonadota bacterium]
MQPLVVGVLVGPHGVRGEVKLRPVTEFPERLPRLKELRLRFPDGHEERKRVLGTRPHREMLLVRLEGVPDMDAADALRGCEVIVSPAEAAPLPEGRYYEHQILGLRVVTPEGEELGRVTEVMPGPSNDVYVAGPWLIPATHDAVLRLDPEEGVLVVRSREYLEGEEVR